MKRSDRVRAAALLLAAILTVGPVQSSDMQLELGVVSGPGWRAEGVRLSVLPLTELNLDISRIVVDGQPALREVHVHCAKFIAGTGARCEAGRFRLRMPGWGLLQGQLQARFQNAQYWTASLRVPGHNLTVELRQAGELSAMRLALQAQPARDLQRLAAAYGAEFSGELSGTVDLHLQAEMATGMHGTLRINVRELGYGEATGRYASEQVSAQAELQFKASGELDLKLLADAGQIYVEPIFIDLAQSAVGVNGVLRPQADGWQLEHVQLAHGETASLVLNGQLDTDWQPQTMHVRLDAQDIASVLQTFLQPMLIGSPLEGIVASGRAQADLHLQGAEVQSLAATVDGLGLNADRLGLALQGLSGKLDWSPTGAAPSQLSWTGGALRSVPLGPSAIAFRAQGRDFELLAPWRQPLLKGAITAERLALRNIGGPQLDADFQGEVEPIRLAQLCKAMGWPEFRGTLAGRLDALTVRNDVWTVDGALQAQAFDGSLRLENLQAHQPFGVLPRISTDVRFRELDLDALTGTFSFGRITGRLDGDIQGLRLLNWEPVAFDARIYSTPGDSSRRRISQRAIDNISSIGGGPTGLLSRGFLSLFEDFAYARLGMSCQLSNGVCRMGGVGAAPASGRDDAYYLVKGRLLPRIDVVGYAQRVSWKNLIAQLRAAQASAGPSSR